MSAWVRKIRSLIAWFRRWMTRQGGMSMRLDEQPIGERFLYFGYGSNMLTTRLTARTPSARMYCTGYVPGRRLTFSKTSDDGSGKGDAEITGDAGDRVHGVLFWIDRAEKPDLDRAEALGRGYDEAVLDVVTPEATVKAVAYVASGGSTDPTRRPYHWYKRLVLAGAIEHGLPADAVAAIRAVPQRTIRCRGGARSETPRKRWPQAASP
jgi:gamma-glutamylcyclotransferase